MYAPLLNRCRNSGNSMTRYNATDRVSPDSDVGAGLTQVRLGGPARHVQGCGGTQSCCAPTVKFLWLWGPGRDVLKLDGPQPACPHLPLGRPACPPTGLIRESVFPGTGVKPSPWFGPCLLGMSHHNKQGHRTARPGGPVWRWAREGSRPPATAHSAGLFS